MTDGHQPTLHAPRSNCPPNSALLRTSSITPHSRLAGSVSMPTDRGLSPPTPDNRSISTFRGPARNRSHQTEERRSSEHRTTDSHPLPLPAPTPHRSASSTATPGPSQWRPRQRSSRPSPPSSAAFPSGRHLIDRYRQASGEDESVAQIPSVGTGLEDGTSTVGLGLDLDAEIEALEEEVEVVDHRDTTQQMHRPGVSVSGRQGTLCPGAESVQICPW